MLSGVSALTAQPLPPTVAAFPVALKAVPLIVSVCPPRVLKPLVGLMLVMMGAATAGAIQTVLARTHNVATNDRGMVTPFVGGGDVGNGRGVACSTSPRRAERTIV